MRNPIFLSLIVLMFILPHFVYAENTWKCIAFDNEKNKWEANHEYQRVAINKALENCKKESKIPKSCETLEELCEHPETEQNEKQTNQKQISVQLTPAKEKKWQCTALDQTAKPWLGLPKFNKDDAALNAKSYCREKSTIPDTCYINLLMCKNLNDPDNEFSNLVNN